METNCSLPAKVTDRGVQVNHIFLLRNNTNILGWIEKLKTYKYSNNYGAELSEMGTLSAHTAILPAGPTFNCRKMPVAA